MSLGPLTILIATANPHKVGELRPIFDTSLADTRGVHLLTLDEAGALTFPPRTFSEPAETGATFAANARIKALAYAAQSGLIALADDSGLEVDALGGRPGVISSHYSSDGREVGIARAQRDPANTGRVLDELAGVSAARRTARFVCCMCLAAPGVPHSDRSDSILAETRATLEGRIGVEPEIPRGHNGFGYDPIFLLAPDFTRTSAELDPSEKNRISHRAQAAAAMAAHIRGLLTNRR
ncbi:XTP/dITP diphosphatase [soil metagenome]